MVAARVGYVETPFGVLTVESSLRGVSRVSLLGYTPRANGAAELSLLTADSCAQLNAYLAGDLHEFTLSLDLGDGSAFEQRVWQLTATIPYGQTRSYGWLARELGDPGAARAVGGALNRNPLLIIVPCHRVIASDGGLGGFGAGMRAKRWLLRHEGSPHAAAQSLWGDD